MRVLFDQGTPAPLRAHLPGCVVVTAYEQGWSTMKNGELLAAAEACGFDVLVTTDTNLRYQQNLVGRRMAIIVLGTTSWPRIRAAASLVADALAQAGAGTYADVAIP